MCLAILFLAFESQEKTFFNSLLSGAKSCEAVKFKLW